MAIAGQRGRKLDRNVKNVIRIRFCSAICLLLGELSPLDVGKLLR